MSTFVSWSGIQIAWELRVGDFFIVFWVVLLKKFDIRKEGTALCVKN